MQTPTRYQTRFGLFTLSLLLLFPILRAALPTPAQGSAQRPVQKSGTTPTVPSGLIVLWDETGTPTGFNTNSQNYEPANDQLDDELADDFFVPLDQTWTIQQVKVEGSYSTGSTGPATSVNVTFYSNASTLPGAAVPGGAFQNVAMVDTAGNFTITLPSSVVLTAGTYWVSVQANMNSITNGHWGWKDNAFQLGAGAAWRNPGGGFMTACTPSWGRRIACVPNPSGADQIFQLLGTSVGGTPTPSPSGTPAPTATPTGNDKIVYSSVSNDNFEIYVMDTNGANKINLTNNPADDVDPAWSPDGTKIAFASARDAGDLEIYVMNADGSNPIRLTNNPADDFSPAWSPDGTKIAFTSARDNQLEIYVMNADGSNQTNLTNNPADDLAPSWSPDGTKIAFASSRDGNDEIYVMDANGANQTNLTNNPADDFTPAWSPDGTKIAFESFRDDNFEIYRMDANGSNPIRLTNSPTDDIYATWSHDGTKIAFTTNRDGNYEIYVMGANDGSNPTNLTNNPTPDENPDWSISTSGMPSPTPTASASVPPTPTPSPTGTATATPTASPSPTPPSAQALNLSTRMLVQIDAAVGIGGFIVTGSAPKRVILRAIGPSLTVTGKLADPVMELHGPAGFTTIMNDNWRDTQEAEIIATGIPPTNNLESAIVATLAPGPYTAIVSGKNGTSGVALVEVYDLDQAAASKLGNISTRAFVSTGSNIMIAGFILGNGLGMDNVILRGIGPSLPVTNKLADPTLELRDSNGALIRSDDNWQDDPAQAALISAAGLAPSNPLESGIYSTLAPGPYTALLAGLNNGTGIGLVEVYSLQ